MMKSPAADEPHLWRGTATLDGAPPQGIGVDVRPGGALRLSRSWLALRDVSTPTGSLMFAFGLNQPAPASDVDGDILRQARDLADMSHWDRHDLTNMDEAPAKGLNCPNVVPARCSALFTSHPWSGPAITRIFVRPLKRCAKPSPQRAAGGFTGTHLSISTMIRGQHSKTFMASWTWRFNWLKAARLSERRLTSKWSRRTKPGSCDPSWRAAHLER